MYKSLKMLVFSGLVVGAFSCGEAPSDEEVLIIPGPTGPEGVDESEMMSTPDPGVDEEGEDEDAPEVVERLAPQYDGECPAITEGVNEIVSAGANRTFRVELPDNPEGAPVLFAWHWLGGNATQMSTALGLGSLADAQGVITIVPESVDANAFEWRFTQAAEGNPDVQLFEDLLACAAEQYDVDLDRIYSTGHSAGGLWTSYLTVHSSEWLAATAISSGGANAGSYQTPEHKLPVLVIWGGPTDTYGSFNFETSSLFLVDELRNDGHFVATCEHSRGHIPPAGIMEYIWAWFEDHPRGAEEPYADGLPAVFPSYCSIPEASVE